MPDDGSGRTFSLYNLCLPDDLTRFLVPAGAIRRWDDGVQVYDVRAGANAVLRHYAFYRRWFEVNCSLDAAGNFVTEPGPIPWTFNIDICTPFFSFGNRGFTVDLCLDVLVGSDGVSHVIIDEEDFAVAVASGWMTVEEQAGARAGLADVLGLIESGKLLAFLSVLCPFDIRPVVQPAFEKPPVSEVSQLDLSQRWRYFGRRG